jgi:hypothetical protein
MTSLPYDLHCAAKIVADDILDAACSAMKEEEGSAERVAALFDARAALIRTLEDLLTEAIESRDSV